MKIPETGKYRLQYKDQVEIVEIKDIYVGQSSTTNEYRVAEFLTGSPRFPIPIQVLIGYGVNLELIEHVH